MTSGDDFARRYQRARDGDRAAQDALVRDMQTSLTAYVRRRAGADVRRQFEPEDLCQTATIRFLQRLPGFPADLDQNALLRRLLRIARWTIADVLKRRRLVLGESAAPALDPPARQPTMGPVTRADERARIERLLARMRPGYAEVLRRVLLQGQTAAAVAAQLDLEPSTVRKRLERARAELERLLPDPPG